MTQRLSLSLHQGSLRIRLLLGTLAWIALAIAIAGWGLRGLFEEHINQQLQDQLVRQLDQLSAAVNFTSEQRIEVLPMAGDARLSTPLSGLYWQVDVLPAQGPAELGIARSRSLWDLVLPLSADTALPGTSRQGYAVLQLQDPQGHTLLAVSRSLLLPEVQAPLLRLTVAADHALLAEPVQRFTTMLLAALGTLAVGLVLAVAVQLQLALRPLNLLHQSLTAVRTGKATQLEGQFPDELQPLVNEFNHVLGANADIVQRARTQAGNLAHAMHTPLTILSNAATQDDTALARLVEEQVAIAQRQINHQLARARAAARQATGLRTPLQPPLESLVRTMDRLHAVHGIHFTLNGAAQCWDFLGDEQDLMEILGNLLDNAGKWANHEVHLSVQGQESEQAGQQLLLTIDDDGPGIEDADLDRIFERGERLDERRPGTGLGLDIVRDLVRTYGGRITGSRSPRGGLRMQLQLPGTKRME
ncbi:sensor histidine kinase [Comamonas sp. NoAH]|uniref:sensor histidine kinase n=1 Tax=Comamonas halotolerans TaxID=3041496 RepID=UPI0024E13D9A|nr:sensor histidine kinase [Comamonas sp. NoAH]